MAEAHVQVESNLGEGATVNSTPPVKSPVAKKQGEAVVADSTQKIILLELQKISSRFGQLEKRAAEDRAVLSGVVQRLGNTSQNSAASRQVAANVAEGGSQVATTSVTNTAGDVNPALTSSLFSNGSSLGLSDRQGQVREVRAERDAARDVSDQQQGNGSRRGQQMDSNPAARTVPPSSTLPSLAHQQMQGSSRSEGWQGARPRIPTQQGDRDGFNVTGSQSQALLAHLANQATHFPSSRSQEVAEQFVLPPDQGGAVEDSQQPIPTLNTIRQAADVNRAVQQRYQELENLNCMQGQGNLDILLDALVKRKTEKVKAKWPQDLAFIGTMRKRPTYEQLNTCQWLLGFLRIQQEETDQSVRDNMISYLC